MASNQRLLFFPIALQVGGALLLLPVTLAAHDTVTFDVYARDVADDRITLELFGASSTSTGTYVALAAAIVSARAPHRLALRRLHPVDQRRRAALVAGHGRVREARSHLPRHRRDRGRPRHRRGQRLRAAWRWRQLCAGRGGSGSPTTRSCSRTASHRRDAIVRSLRIWRSAARACLMCDHVHLRRRRHLLAVRRAPHRLRRRLPRLLRRAAAGAALARLRQRLPADRAAAGDAGRAAYCTRIRAPGVSFSGSTFGFSSVSASTVVLKSSAIDENDSPSLTRWTSSPPAPSAVVPAAAPRSRRRVVRRLLRRLLAARVERAGDDGDHHHDGDEQRGRGDERPRREAPVASAGAWRQRLVSRKRMPHDIPRRGAMLLRRGRNCVPPVAARPPATPRSPSGPRPPARRPGAA